MSHHYKIIINYYKATLLSAAGAGFGVGVSCCNSLSLRLLAFPAALLQL